MEPKAYEEREIPAESRMPNLRIGIGEAFWGGVDFFGIQIRFSDGSRRNVPLHSAIARASEIFFPPFSPSNRPVSSICFSDRRTLWAFCQFVRISDVPPAFLARAVGFLVARTGGFVLETDSQGKPTSRFVDRSVAEEEGIGRISVRYWAVNPDVFRERGDVGVYFKAPSGTSGYGLPFEELGSDPVGCSLQELRRLDRSAQVSSETDFQARADPSLRGCASVLSTLRSIRERVGITLSRSEFLPSVFEDGRVDPESAVPDVPALRSLATGVRTDFETNGFSDAYVFECFENPRDISLRTGIPVRMVASAEILRLVHKGSFWETVVRAIRESYGISK